jgi:hypothetical protein
MSTKESGLGWTTFSVDDSGGTPRDLKSDAGTLSFATPRGVQVVTGIGSSAEERLLLLADFSCTVAGPAFDDATASSHSVFKTVSSTSVARTTTIVVSGNTLAPEVLYSDYQLSRGQDGSFGFTAPGVLADGAVPTWS